MDDQNDRVTRAQRRGADPALSEEIRQAQERQPAQAEGAPQPRKRRRSQSLHMRADHERADEMMEDTYVPPSRDDLEKRRIYGPRVPANQERFMPPKDRRPDAAYDDDGDDEHLDGVSLHGEGDDFVEGAKVKRHFLRWIVICTLILALLAGVTYVGLQRPELIEPVVKWANELIFGPAPTPEPTPEPTPIPLPTPTPLPDASMAKVVRLVASPEDQPDINLPISFQVTTTEQTTRVRIVDGNGQILIEGTESDYTDASDGRVWNLFVYFLAPYEGNVEAYPGNESGWNEANSSLYSIKVGDPSTVEAQAAWDPNEEMGGVSAIAPIPSSAGETRYADVVGRVVIGGEPVDSFIREKTIQMGDEETYRGAYGMNGVLAFRGSGMRQNSAFGKVSPVENRLESRWSEPVGDPSDGHATWGAQPLIVQWHANIRGKLDLNMDKRTKKSFKEVIFPGNDGYLYFFDLDDGSEAREAFTIEPVMPMLGAPSVCPDGLPLLMVGSGDPADTAPVADTGLHIHTLLSDKNLMLNKKSILIRSDRPEAESDDPSYITSALVDISNSVVISVGGNGLLYTMTLHPTINTETPSLTVAPKLETYASASGAADMTVDSSPAAYGEYVYFATNGGILQSVNLNTLSTQWAVDLGVDTDAAIALEAEGGWIALYTASRADGNGFAHMRRIDAATGGIQWDLPMMGNCSASPLVGKEGISDLVIFTVSKSGGGTVYALDKETGDVIWSYPLDSDTASSPIALHDEAGSAWIVQGDAVSLHLIDGRTGANLDKLAMASPVIGSPAAFEGTIVVATQDARIHAIELR